MRPPMEGETNAAAVAGNEKDQSSQSPTLPDDVVFDILSRLPVQWLLQYRCVCKSWRSMISDAQFIKTHLDRSTKSAESQRLLLITKPSHYYFQYFDSIDCEISNHATITLESLSENLFSYSPPLCSCDGLILSEVQFKPPFTTKYPGKSFILWNPSIRAFKRLSCPYNFGHCALFGLCYDSNIDDYRVVVLNQYDETFVVIGNSKTNSWNLIKVTCYSILCRVDGVLVNGALHWVMTSNKLCSWVIVYFDLAEAKFKEVPRPSLEDESKLINLVVLRGWLCGYRCIDEQKLEIWAMKEYGKKESWTSLIVIQLLPHFCYPKPLCFKENGEVLIRVDIWELVIYNPKDGTFRDLRSYGIVNRSRGVTYVESLVFLNGGKEIGWEQQRHPKIRNMKRRLV